MNILKTIPTPEEYKKMCEKEKNLKDEAASERYAAALEEEILRKMSAKKKLTGIDIRRSCPSNFCESDAWKKLESDFNKIGWDVLYNKGYWRLEEYNDRIVSRPRDPFVVKSPEFYRNHSAGATDGGLPSDIVQAIKIHERLKTDRKKLIKVVNGKVLKCNDKS